MPAKAAKAHGAILAGAAAVLAVGRLVAAVSEGAVASADLAAVVLAGEVPVVPGNFFASVLFADIDVQRACPFNSSSLLRIYNN
jgi:hypothetical protein